MAKLSATAISLAILYFVVVVNAAPSNCHLTTTTTTTAINEENPRTTSLGTCQDEINGKDLQDCKNIISGSPDFNPLTCCSQLGAIGGDIRCRCVALNQIIKEQEEEGDHDIEDLKSRAAFIVIYCRMGTPAGCLRDAALSSILKNHI